MISFMKSVPKPTYLLISILIFIFGSFIFEYYQVTNYSTIILYSLIFISTYFSMEKKSNVMKALLFIGLFLNLFIFVSSNKYLQLSVLLISALIFTFIAFVLIGQIAKSKKVNSYILIEAINGYLLIGIIITLLNSLLLLTDNNAINFTTKPNLSDIIYYSYINLTSIGFGDIVPKAQFAKKISIFTGISGQLYLAIIIALIVGKLNTSKQ